MIFYLTPLTQNRAVGTGDQGRGVEGPIAPPHQDFGRDKSKTFSSKVPSITTLPLDF